MIDFFGTFRHATMIDDIKKQLSTYFPVQSFSDSAIEKGLARGEILTEKEEILPFLQTALVDEKVLEVELDGVPQVYFSRLKDDIPLTFETEESDDSLLLEEVEYNLGDYLTQLSHIVTLPLEPGLGNLYLRQSRFIVLRMFINTFALELVSIFEDLAKVGDLPVLKLSFPLLAKKVDNAREFRAKVPDSFDFMVGIGFDDELPELSASPVDIGNRGMALAVSKEEQKMFQMGSHHSIKLYVQDELQAALQVRVRHLSRVRKKVGIEYVCGVEFELTTRTLAAAIESIVASVQRAHLKDLADKADATGFSLII